MKLMRYAFVACVMFGLSGCGGNASKIVGKWEMEGSGGALVIEFTSDGKAIVNVGGTKIEGKYEVSGSTLKTTGKNPLTGKETTEESTIESVSDTELVLKQGGQTKKFKKK